ncbi:heme biosynthesis protein HemY [Pseudoprimorskyibacter insulae]|uniref:Lipopolysaccharide assembly protein B n=1 Tax=Pseudoprimorskyibacter insulae TaxID=1695997 RepID=A0A2R8AYM6_9RHOB|nr:heme biosynthesis HemY N-terminal domain-containing protein [Pseudoprimorskyibacter insulae]SPF81141.1 Lipopolysaccharide assembly protein B [Pseudoprimorskyibacter insulae]
MIWSLIKIVVFVILIGALTLGAGFLMESDGGIQITAAGKEFVLGPLESVIGAVVLVVLIWLFFKLATLIVALLKFLNGDETAISRYFDRNRERKGFQALSDGMMALASGEGRVAMAKAEKAERYLHKPELTDLITAQAAEMVGDKTKAEKVYKRMIQREETRFVGVRGIMKQKLDAGDTDMALKLAERAFAIRPRHEEVQNILLQLQAEKGDWSGARHTLNAKLKHGSLPRDVHKRRDAVLALSEAKGILDEGKSIEAREAAIEANKRSPDLIPAAALAARGYVDQQRPRLAVRILKKAWEVQPHPDLAAAFAAIEPNETPQERLKRFQAITKIRPDHRETRLLLAELNIAAEDFPEARRSVGDLAEVDADARVLTIMAAIERGEGSSDQVVRGWLARALTAPRGPQWVCDNCNHIHGEWAPVCGHCHSFDTLSWKTPPQSDLVMPAGAEMLPLIVGAIEDKSKDAPEAEPMPEPVAEIIAESDAAPEPDDSDVIDAGPQDAELVDEPAEKTTKPEAK